MCVSIYSIVSFNVLSKSSLVELFDQLGSQYKTLNNPTSNIRVLTCTCKYTQCLSGVKIDLICNHYNSRIDAA